MGKVNETGKKRLKTDEKRRKSEVNESETDEMMLETEKTEQMT